MMNEATSERWISLCGMLGLCDVAQPRYEELAELYGRSGRAYHTLDHVSDCLREFDASRHLAEHPARVELALWLHDVIYDPRGHDNERRSADWAAAMLREAGTGEGVVALIESLILDTRHDGSAATPDGALVADIDLAILGRDPAAFEAYESAVRREYAWVPRPDYVRDRVEVLRRFLQRKCIYQTEHYRTRYEASARGNLARSIERLLSEENP